MSKLARRHRRRKFKKNPSAPKRNPPITQDLLEWVAPGFGGFAASRLVTGIAQKQIAKRFPKAGKHAGAIAALGSFLAAWWFGNRVSFIARYHTPITVGAAIAAGQSLLQIYAPNKLGWIVSDASSSAAQVAPAPQQQALPSNMEEVSPGEAQWYTMNDAYDSGRYGSLAKGGAWSPGIQQPREEETPMIDDVQAGDEEDAAGIFGS